MTGCSWLKDNYNSGSYAKKIHTYVYMKHGYYYYYQYCHCYCYYYCCWLFYLA